MAATETTRSDQVTEGEVELKGTVQARETVHDPMHGEEAVLVDWELTRQETHTDADGTPDTREHTVASGRRQAVFDLADDGGTVRVDPAGATLKVDSRNRMRETFRGNDTTQLEALKEQTDGDQSGTERPGVSVRADGVDFRLSLSSDDRRTYTHEVLKPGDEVYVLGVAERDEAGVVVGRGDTRGKYLLSNMSEDELSETFGTNKWLLGAITVGFGIAAGYFLLFG